MDTHDSLPIRTDPDETAVRARSIRTRLPGQMARERLETAALLYGPLYGIAEIRQRVAATLLRRVGFVRGTLREPIESYGALSRHPRRRAAASRRGGDLNLRNPLLTVPRLVPRD